MLLRYDRHTNHLQQEKHVNVLFSALRGGGRGLYGIRYPNPRPPSKEGQKREKRGKKEKGKEKKGKKNETKNFMHARQGAGRVPRGQGCCLLAQSVP